MCMAALRELEVRGTARSNGLDVTVRTNPVGHRMSQEEFADILAWLDSYR